MPARNHRLFVNMLLFVVFIQIPGLSYGAVTVTRLGASDDDCERLCIEEAEIDCRYYKFVSVKAICTLSTDQDPITNDLTKLDEGERKTADSWVTHLQARILALEQKDTDLKSLHREIAELRTEIEALKNGRALTHHLIRTNKEQTDQNLAAIDDKVETAIGEIKRVEDTVLTLGDMQKTLGNRLRQVNEDLTATAVTVTMLSQSSKDTHASLREIGSDLAEMRISISDTKKSITDLQVRFAALSTDVMEKVASVDAMVGPELKDLKLSQTTLAQALALLTKKIMAIAPRIPELQKRISSRDGKLTVVDMQLQGLARQLTFLTERTSFTEVQIKHVVDPGSRLNVERRQTLMRVQGQVESLITTQTRMQNDLLAEIADRSRIYKEFSTLRLERKSIIDHIVNMEEDVVDLKKAVRTLMADEPKSKLLSSILSRQLSILKSVKRLRDRQDASRTNLVNYKAKIEIEQQEMLRRIVVRKATDQALITMLTKLFDAYRGIRSQLQNDNTKMVVRRLMEQYNQAAKKINTVRRRQQAMIEAIVQNRWIIQNARKVLVLQKNERQNTLFQLASVKKQTMRLNKMIVDDKMRTELFNEPSVFRQMKKLSEAQTELSESLTQYKMDVQKTQAELFNQKKDQQIEAVKSMGIRKQLQTLHQTVQALLDRENQRLQNVADLTRGLQALQYKLREESLFPTRNDIRNTVAAELGRLAEENHSQSRHLANVAELNRRIKAAKIRDSSSGLVEDIHNTVADELERQARKNLLKNKRIADVAKLNQRLELMKKQKENEQLQNYIQEKEDLLDSLREQKLIK